VVKALQQEVAVGELQGKRDPDQRRFELPPLPEMERVHLSVVVEARVLRAIESESCRSGMGRNRRCLPVASALAAQTEEEEEVVEEESIVRELEGLPTAAVAVEQEVSRQVEEVGVRTVLKTAEVVEGRVEHHQAQEALAQVMLVVEAPFQTAFESSVVGLVASCQRAGEVWAFRLYLRPASRRA
jgi:hypothetical protein